MWGRRGTITGTPRTFSSAKLTLNGRPNNACSETSSQHKYDLLWKMTFRFKSTSLNTFPSIASFADMASFSLEKWTNPKPLDRPVSLSYIILTRKNLSKSETGRLYEAFQFKSLFSKDYLMKTLWSLRQFIEHIEDESTNLRRHCQKKRRRLSKISRQPTMIILQYPISHYVKNNRKDKNRKRWERKWDLQQRVCWKMKEVSVSYRIARLKVKLSYQV